MSLLISASRRRCLQDSKREPVLSAVEGSVFTLLNSFKSPSDPERSFDSSLHLRSNNARYLKLRPPGGSYLTG